MKPTTSAPIRFICCFALLTAALISGAPAAWKNNEAAHVIIGRTKLPSATTFYQPNGIAVSPADGKVFVVDSGHNRVLRFSSAAALGNGQAAEAVLGQPDFQSAAYGRTQQTLRDPGHAAIDSAGNLWVSDTGNHRILRWANAGTAPNGSPADQVLGQPDFITWGANGGPSGLNYPSGLAADSSGRLWVVDYWNNRVLRFDNAATKGNGSAADGVIGQPNLTTNAPGLSAIGLDDPFDLAIDAQGRLWVADFGNSRVLRYDNPATQNQPSADGVLGQPDFVTNTGGSGPAKTNRAVNLAVSATGSLFVMDTGGSRVMRWDQAATKANGADADGVIGRTGLAADADFPATTGYLSNDSRGMKIDASGRLWLVDRSSERVLHWDQAATLPNGPNADGVIGAASIHETLRTSLNPATSPAGPLDGLEDPVSGKFFIADSGRVLRYPSRDAAEAGGSPEAFLGKTTPAEYGGGAPSATNLRSAWGLALDGNGKLWVSDPDGHRVVAFAQAATAPTNATMAVVLGQSSFTASSSGLAQDRMNRPRSLVIDAAGNLYVADSENHRVLRFDGIAGKTTGAPADAVIGQPDFITASTAVNNALLKTPHGLALDQQGRLWVADTGKNRIARYDAPLTMTPSDAPSGTLGGVASLSPSGMNQPKSLALSGSGRLWVLDSGFQRVMRFENAAAKPNGAAADGVIGAPTLNTSTQVGRSRQSFYSPEGLFLDATGSLWVCDNNNARLMKFVPASSVLILQSGLDSAQKFALTFEALDPGTYELRSSTDLKNWDLESTYQLTTGETRTFGDNKGGNRRFFRIDEP